MGLIDTIWHKRLRRPYQLARKIDTGSGQTVVFLHGIAARAEIWVEITDRLDKAKFRSLAFDLLGFADSPNPEWSHYSVDDHAKSVIASIRRSRAEEPVILVGHSMGAVIASRVAHLEPNLAKQLILYQIPVYSDYSKLGIRDMRNKAYISFLESLSRRRKITLRSARLLEKVGSKAVQFSVDEKNWLAFQRSIRNTIMHEGVFDDIQSVGVPIDIIYGSYDPIVLRRSMRRVFKESKNVRFYKVDETHRISKRSAKLIAQLVESAHHNP